MLNDASGHIVGLAGRGSGRAVRGSLLPPDCRAAMITREDLELVDCLGRSHMSKSLQPAAVSSLVEQRLEARLIVDRADRREAQRLGPQQLCATRWMSSAVTAAKPSSTSVSSRAWPSSTSPRSPKLTIERGSSRPSTRRPRM